MLTLAHTQSMYLVAKEERNKKEQEERKNLYANVTHSLTDCKFLLKWKSCRSFCGSRSRALLFAKCLLNYQVSIIRYIRPRYLPVITYLFLLQNKSEIFIEKSFSV